MGNVSLEIETFLDAPPTLATPVEDSYENYRGRKGILDEETYSDAIAQLQKGDLSTEKFKPSTVDDVPGFERVLGMTFSPKQIFLYRYLHERLRPSSGVSQGPNGSKPRLCDRGLFLEVLKMTADLDTLLEIDLFEQSNKPAGQKPFEFSGAEEHLKPIFRNLKPRQEQSSSK